MGTPWLANMVLVNGHLPSSKHSRIERFEAEVTSALHKSDWKPSNHMDLIESLRMT